MKHVIKYEIVKFQKNRIIRK